MTDAIWQPREEVEGGVFVFGEDVTEVCAIEDVFQGRKDADPNWRTVGGIYISVAGVESQ